MIEIGILDSHPVVRAGLRRLFAAHDDLHIASEGVSVADGSTLIGCANKLDVLLVDLPESGQRGVDVIARFRSQAPRTGILVFTAYAAGHYALECLRQGARGYLNKDCDPCDIVKATRSIAGGRRHISPPVAELLANQIGHDCGNTAHHQLSVRETEVFHKLAKGDTATAIASALALSVKTVSTYRTRLLEKLNLSNNSDLTYYAINNHLIA